LESWPLDWLVGRGSEEGSGLSAEAGMGVETDRGESLVPLLEASERDRPILPPIDILRPLSVHPELSFCGELSSFSPSPLTDRSVDAMEGILDFRESGAGKATPEASGG
jgi:hypothetical protein